MVLVTLADRSTWLHCRCPGLVVANGVAKVALAIGCQACTPREWNGLCFWLIWVWSGSPFPWMFHFTAGFAIKVCGEKLLSFDRAGHMHRVYTFPPGASVPWHIHPDAHDFDYELDRALTLQSDVEGSNVLKRGDAIYVAPNVVHRGLNVSRTQAAKIFVVRVKPKDKPLTTEVQP